MTEEMMLVQAPPSSGSPSPDQLEKWFPLADWRSRKPPAPVFPCVCCGHEFKTAEAVVYVGEHEEDCGCCSYPFYLCRKCWKKVGAKFAKGKQKDA